MHTTTKTTVKMNKGNIFDNNIEYNISEGLADKTEIFKRLRKF